MTGFEYASGLISIVVGLGIARVLGGFGAFLNLEHRSPRDWIVAAWCVLLFLVHVAWWMVGWQVLRQQAEISLGTLAFWSFATALLYLAAYVLVSGSEGIGSLRLPNRAFFVCLALHFGVLPLFGVATAPRPISQFTAQLFASFVMTVATASGVFVRTQRGYAVHLGVLVAILIIALSSLAPVLQ